MSARTQKVICSFFPIPYDSNYNSSYHQLVCVALMSTFQSLSLPPGFEQLSKEQQIDYVPQLWDMIIALPDEVPVSE